VPADLAARAALRGRRIVRRRRIEHTVLWALLVAALVTGIVFAVLDGPHRSTPDLPTDTWWSQSLRR
jgi:H+/Cl- antiporter ClcA